MGAEPEDTRGGDLRTIGEFGLIAAVTARLGSGPLVETGPGDDAAVVRAPDGRVVVTTDVLVEGVHFRRDWSTAYDVGVKAAAQNCADVAAMGARATALVVGVAAPGDLPVSWALGLVDGLRDESGRAGARRGGGDTTSAPSVVVSVTVLGDLEGRAPLLRSGARPGDRVVVAGRLGRSAAGLALLRGGESRLLDEFAALVQVHRRPRPDYPTGPALAGAGASSLLDTSDGLLQDLGHVARASGVRLELDPALLAEDADALDACAASLGTDPWEWVLSGGEDHALVGTLPAGRAVPDGVRVIGTVSAAEGAPGSVVVRGRDLPERPGWDHFARPGPL